MRTVLLKEVLEGRFVFYSNYDSRKGKQIAANPHVALTFLWHELERQIHIEGTIERLPAAESVPTSLCAPTRAVSEHVSHHRASPSPHASTS